MSQYVWTCAPHMQSHSTALQRTPGSGRRSARALRRCQQDAAACRASAACQPGWLTPWWLGAVAAGHAASVPRAQPAAALSLHRRKPKHHIYKASWFTFACSHFTTQHLKQHLKRCGCHVGVPRQHPRDWNASCVSIHENRLQAAWLQPAWQECTPVPSLTCGRCGGSSAAQPSSAALSGQEALPLGGTSRCVLKENTRSFGDRTHRTVRLFTVNCTMLRERRFAAVSDDVALLASTSACASERASTCTWRASLPHKLWTFVSVSACSMGLVLA